MPTPSPTPTQSPWAWVPSLYFAEGIPYVLVMSVSVVMYKRLGISNTEIALYTSWLYLPWVIKPLWSPIVDLMGTKRLWTVAHAVRDRRRVGHGGIGDPGTAVLSVHDCALLADGLQLGHARCRRRRFLYARPEAARAGCLRRRPRHVLSTRHDRRRRGVS